MVFIHVFFCGRVFNWVHSYCSCLRWVYFLNHFLCKTPLVFQNDQSHWTEFLCSYLLNRFKLMHTLSLFCYRVYQMKMWIRFFSLYFVKGFSLFQRVKASIPFWFELFILPFLSIVSILSSNQNTTTHSTHSILTTLRNWKVWMSLA